jgi:serine/threonine protein phosphatase PrpC
VSSVITRCIGADETPPVVDLWRVHLGGGSSLVLCSDGLHRSVAPETILEVVQSKAPQEAADALVRAAVLAGAGDDVSVAVLRYAP